jgi:hypothetical protein
LSRNRKLLTLGFGVAAAAIMAIPTQAQAASPQAAASNGWKKIGTYDTYTCFQKANWYHDHGGSRAERCDSAGPNLSTLWVLIDD